MRKIENAGYRLHSKKCEFFKQGAEWVVHRRDQTGIIQDKLEANTKIDLPKKRTKIFSGSNPLSVKIYRKPISTDRHPQKNADQKNTEKRSIA